MKRIAVIGAGLAGLTLARQLADTAKVMVFDKSRSPGGRMATRREGIYEFDHGAQFFIAKTAAFSTEIKRWQTDSVVAPWNIRFAELDRSAVMAMRDWDAAKPHFVAVPGMNQLGKYLAASINLRSSTRVAELARVGDSWSLTAEDQRDLGTFDWVIATAPAAQTAALLPAEFAHHEAIAATRMKGCYALLLGFREVQPLDWQAALVHNADISWIAVNSSKPERGDNFSVLAHSTNAFAEAHMHDDLDAVREHLVAELARVSGLQVANADLVKVHRWRYANIDAQAHAPSLIDFDNRLAACGDWCIRGRVEAAYSSALDLSARLSAAL